MRRQFGSVRQRKGRDGWFISIRRDGRNYTRRAGSTKRKAEAALAKVWVMVQDGHGVEDAIAYVLNERPDCVMTWEAATNRYLDHLEDVRSPDNMKRERSRAKCILDTDLNGRDIADTDRGTVARWLDGHRTRQTRRKAKPSGKTLNRFLSFGSAVWAHFEERGHISGTNPFQQVKRAPEPPLDKTPLRTEEVLAVVRHASEHARPLFLTGGSEGLRVGELMKLQWRDVSMDERTIWVRYVRAKREKARAVPMTDAVHAVLLDIRPPEPFVPSLHVFLRKNGKPWTYKSFEKAMDRAVERALAAEELRPGHARCDLTPKALRDAFITNLMLLGVGWETYGALAGHSSPSTSRRYLGIASDVQRSAIDLLGSRLGSHPDQAKTETA